MKEITSAVILAAGLGTRLKSLTQDKPKALMLIAGEPAINHVIRQLVAQGIHDIAINTYHYADQLHHHLGRGSHFNANLYFSHESKLLDSGGGVRTALDQLPHRERIAVYNADIISNINLRQLADLCPENGCSLALVQNPKHNLNGDFSLDKQKVSMTGHDTYTFAGVSVWSEQALNTYPINTSFPLTTPMRELITKQQCMGAVHHGHWFDIGRPRDLVQANRQLNIEGL